MRVARSADEIVLAIGTRGALCREGWSDAHLGDRDRLRLIDQQQRLADAMFALGKPVVVVLINSCPLSVVSIKKKANALIEGWYLGEAGGKILRGFKRVSLAPGASTEVHFTLGWRDFAIWNYHLHQVVEPGTVRIMLGPDSVHLRTATLRITG